MQIEAVEVCLARAAGGDVVGRAWFVAPAPHPRPRARAQRDAALDRGADEAGQHRRCLRERVCGLRVRSAGLEIGRTSKRRTRRRMVVSTWATSSCLGAGAR